MSELRRVLPCVTVLAGFALAAASHAACCLPDDTCIETPDEATCSGQGGTYSEAACAEVACPFEEFEGTFMFPLSPGAQQIALPQFDTQGGLRTLERVVVTLDLTISAAVTVENDSSLPQPDVAVSLSGLGSLDVPDAEAEPLLISEVFFADVLAASDGVPGSGPDFFDFGVVGGSTVTQTEPALVTAYSGTGTVDATVEAFGGLSVSLPVDSTIMISLFQAFGIVRIRYEYRSTFTAGACCFPDGSCFSLDSTNCFGLGGEYQGDLTLCGDVVCDEAVGACCLLDGTCVEVAAADCDVTGGFYQGDLTVCMPEVECPVFGLSQWQGAGAPPLDFLDPANWDGGGVPTTGSTARFDAGDFVVDASADALIDRLEILSGLIQFEMAGRVLNAQEFLASPSIVVRGPTSPELVMQSGTINAVSAQIGGDGEAGTLVVGPFGTVLLFGTLEIGVGGAGDGAVRIEPGGQLSVASVLTIGSLTGTGTLSIEGSSVVSTGQGVLVSRGLLELIDDPQLQVGPSSAPLVTVATNGALFGRGSIDGNLSSRGAVEVPAGSLAIDGSYDQRKDQAFVPRAAGTMFVGLAPTDAGRLDVQGDACLGGLLVATIEPGYDPPLGAAFEIVRAGIGGIGSVVGRFDVAVLPALSGGKFLRVVYPEAGFGASTVRIEVESLDQLFDGFDPQEASFGLNGPTGVDTADFDQDGDLDVVVVAPGSDDLIILVNGGTNPADGAWLGFTETVQIGDVGAGPIDVVAADLDADDRPDLVVANRDDNTVSVYVNDDSGSVGGFFAPRVNVGLAEGVPDDPDVLAVADVALEDGIVDVVVAGAAAELQVFRNNGAGALTLDDVIPLPSKACALDPEDLEEDRDTDIVATRCGGAAISLILFEQGDAVITTNIEVDVDPVDVVAIDLDGDGLADVVTANAGGTSVSIVRNEGLGQFAPAANAELAAPVTSIDAIDVDGDGDADLVAVIEADPSEVVVLRNDSVPEEITLAEPETVPGSAGAVLVIGGDVDGDDFEDVIVIAADDGAGFGPPGGPPVVYLNRRCAEDVNNDGTVDFQDLLVVLANWGLGGDVQGDLNGDDEVDFQDLLLILSAFGPCT